MVIFPDADILVREIESWRGFADALRKEDRLYFNEMLEECFRYSAAINQKGEPFPTEALILSLILHQHKIIRYLFSLITKEKLH